MKDNLLVKLATNNDANLIKNLINEMYGIEYEKREISQIEVAIVKENEIYSIAMLEGEVVGFCGASIIGKGLSSIDYIYVCKNHRNLTNAYECLKVVFNKLIKLGINSAHLQVQTYNKQRFLHYALSDKNIIKEEDIEWKGVIYKDQILLIENLQSVVNLSLKELIKKAHLYSKSK